MTNPLADLASRFRFNESVIGQVSDGLTPDDWSASPSESGGNTPHWILGHIASSRRYLLRKVGGEVAEEPWEDVFSMSAKPTSTDGYPTPAALLADLKAIGEQVGERLEAMTDAEADAEWGGTFPDGGKTFGAAARFLYFHESYHLGQLGLLRRMRGHDGFA